MVDGSPSKNPKRSVSRAQAGREGEGRRKGRAGNFSPVGPIQLWDRESKDESSAGHPATAVPPSSGTAKKAFSSQNRPLFQRCRRCSTTTTRCPSPAGRPACRPSSSPSAPRNHVSQAPKKSPRPIVFVKNSPNLSADAAMTYHTSSDMHDEAFLRRKQRRNRTTFR